MASLDLLQSTRKQTNKATDMKVSAGFVHFHPLPHSKPKPPATLKCLLGVLASIDFYFFRYFKSFLSKVSVRSFW